MKKLGLILLATLILGSCSTWEERSQESLCFKQGKNSYNYEQGQALGFLLGYSGGLRKCQWGKNYARHYNFYEDALKRPSPIYNDCWCQGYLVGYDDGRFFRIKYGDVFNLQQ